MMSSDTPEPTAKDNVVDFKYWDDRWQTGEVGFHKQDVHADFIQYENEMLPTKGSIFFPLCGKSVDMAYIASKGHKVVGLEFSTKAIEDFFNESGLDYEVTKVEGHPFKLYRCKNSNVDINIYYGDVNDATVDLLGHYDVVWDRGSFVAINKPAREKYAQLITELLKKDAKLFLFAVEYDSTVYGGPPHCVTADDVEKHFQTHFFVETLKRTDIMSPRYAGFNLRQVDAVLYKLTRKT